MNICTPLIFLVLGVLGVLPFVLMLLGLRYTWPVQLMFAAVICGDFMALDRLWKALDHFILD